MVKVAPVVRDLQVDNFSVHGENELLGFVGQIFPLLSDVIDMTTYTLMFDYDWLENSISQVFLDVAYPTIRSLLSSDLSDNLISTVMTYQLNQEARMQSENISVDMSRNLTEKINRIIGADLNGQKIIVVDRRVVDGALASW